VTRTVRLTVTKDGSPYDFTGLQTVLRIDRDNSDFHYEPQFTVEGDDNNIIVFTWAADKQPLGDYTIEVAVTDGSGNMDRVNWHGATGVRLVEYSNLVKGEDAAGVESDSELGLDGIFTMNGTGMSAYDEWLAQGHTGTEADYIAWMQQPAREAASVAEAAMTVIQARADEDHATAGSDHTTATGDHAVHIEDHRIAGLNHLKAEDDHTRANTDHSRAESDHSRAEDDHSTAGADHTQAGSDHTRANTDHSRSESDHVSVVADHLQAAADHTKATQDSTRAGSDHDIAVADHAQAEADHTRAESDHTTAAADHTTAASDHTTAAADHTQAVADHAVMAGYDTRLTNVETDVTQLGQEVNGATEIQYQEQTPYNQDHYYNTNASPLAEPSGYGNVSGVYCKMVTVTPGEKYRITGMGGNQYVRLYATADSNKGKLRYADTSLNARTTPVELTIQDGEKYLYVNLSSYDSTTDKFEKVVEGYTPGLKDEVDEHTVEIAAIQREYAEIDTLKYRKPKVFASNALPNYEQYIQEAYIVKLPSGDVILKRYGTDVYFYTKSSGVYANASLSGVVNGKPVPIKVYMTNDTTNYPIDTIIGYLVFSDVDGFAAAAQSASDNSFVVRSVAENIAFSPIISAYLESKEIEPNEKIEVALPSTIYAVVGDTLQLYYRSIFRCVDYSKYNVDVKCSIGHQYPRYYELTPTAGNIGTRSITFSIRDNNNNVIGTKTATLAVVSAGQSPASELNVLCVGASGTLNGEWASELKRRLTASDGAPTGSGFTNINFVGRKSATHYGKQVNVEATGGYQFTSYTSTTTARYRFNVTAENEPSVNVGDVYSNNGNNYTVVEINITPGSGGYFSCEGSGTPQSSGVLTKVSGTGSASITYSSSSFSGNPFVYDGAINMQQYADDYCNPQNAAHGRIDVVYTELFINGTQPYMDDFASRMSQMQAFITQVRSAFPSCKFCIGLSWNPDIRGGMGANYGATGNWHNPYGIKYSNHGLCNALQKYITDNNLSDYVFVLNWLNEFDEENDMQQTTKKVNPRSNVTEIFGANGVHPSDVGYNQLADSAWRLFVAKFCQSE
jgi:hypothetical protein